MSFMKVWCNRTRKPDSKKLVSLQSQIMILPIFFIKFFLKPLVKNNLKEIPQKTKWY